MRASIAVEGEVQHPGSYGIRPGERLSSVLTRAGGFGAQAYPYGAVLVRRDVRDLEMKSHTELIQRVKAEEVSLKALPDTEPDQRTAKLTAIAQTETADNFRRDENILRCLHKVAFRVSQKTETLAGNFDDAFAELRLSRDLFADFDRALFSWSI